jgi:hypothetical protein
MPTWHAYESHQEMLCMVMKLLGLQLHKKTLLDLPHHNQYLLLTVTEAVMTLVCIFSKPSM